MNDEQPDPITYVGRTTFRNAGTPFGIRQQDRRSHFYVVGKTGTGKSTLLYTMAGQDVICGRGVALFDPHGDLAERLKTLASQIRNDDLIYLNVADPALTWTFNPFAGVPEDKRSLAAAGLVEVFKKLWPDDWGPRLEHLLRNVVYTLLENPGSTLGDIPPLLADKDFREQLVSSVENEAVRDFWRNEFAKYSQPFRAVVVAPLQNKIGALLTDAILRRILTEDGSRLDLRTIMDGGKVLIVNLDKGRIGEGPAAILGSLLVSHIALAGISRSDSRERERRDFFVYLDEFHTFATQSLATMLSELRKYRVGMVLAHQHLSQIDPAIRDAVFGNVGTIIAFRVGAEDAQYIARELAPTFIFTDLTSLPRYNMYLRLLIDGEQSRPFSARAIGSPDEVPRNVEH
jgi:type IV secretory pathway TraG/TraD family ATPase VirD4